MSLRSLRSVLREPRPAWLTRWSSAGLAILALVIPVLAFAEAWNVNHPLWQVFFKGPIDALCVVLIVLLVLGLVLIVDAVVQKDYEFLFGAATVAIATVALLATVTALMPWIAFSESAGARWFGLLLAFWILALVMIAYDWVRKNLILASLVTAIALGGFVVRAGYDDLRDTQHQKRADVVAAATTAKAQLKQQADDTPGTLNRHADAARQDLVNVIFEVQPANIPTGLRQAAVDIYSKTPTTYDRPVNPALVDAFDEQAANQPENAAVVVIGLKINTHAFVDAVAAAAAWSPSSVDDLGATLQQKIDTATADLDTAAWPTDVHDMTVALAAYRAAVTGSATDKKAYQVSLAAPLPRPDPGFGVLEAVTDGPQALWIGATKKNLRPLVPGPLGWVLLGALALGIWGTLLRQNALQPAGPVSIPSDDKTDAKLVKVLRVAVLRNLDEPGAAPGASSANPVTDLISVVGGSLTGFAKVLDVVYKVAGRRYGYEVTMDVTSDQPDTTVLIRVKSIAGEHTFAGHVFTGDTEAKVVRAAGLWAAGTILERSSRVPSWAAWNAATAEALSTAFQDAPTTAQLEDAVHNAPGSGLLLAMLGQRYEVTSGRRPDAIELYARAVAAHPRYIVARYRLGAALAAMRTFAWVELELDEMQRLLISIRRAAAALQAPVEHLIPADPKLVHPDFMRLAGHFLEHLDVDTRLVHRLVAALRRSDRDAIAPLRLIRWSSPAARFHPVVKSVCLAYDKSFDASEIMTYASRPRRWWQVSYNAACGLAYRLPEPAAAGDAAAADARTRQLDEALTMLEQTLVRPGIHQLRAEWVTQDVDLQPLKDEPRFKAYVKQLRRGA